MKVIGIALTVLLALTRVSADTTEYYNEHEPRGASSPKPLNPNIVLDYLDTAVVEQLKKLHMDKNRFLNVKGSYPYSGGDIQVEVHGIIRNIGSIRRAKKATLDAKNKKVYGTYGFYDLNISGKYSASVPANGAAPSESIKGKISLLAKRLFCDMKLSVNDKGIPVNLDSISGRAGNIKFLELTGADTNYKPIYESALQSALTKLLEDACYRPIANVIINSGIATINE